MGRSRKASFRWTTARAQVSGSLHSSRGHLQPPPSHSRNKTMTLDAVEFIRRFLLHVLPAGMVRIRHFGFLANRVRKQKLIQCRALLAASAAPIPIDSDDSTPSVEDPHG